MSKSVRRFLLGNLWDFGKNESWFSDMALKGMHLQSIGSWFVVFEKGEPKKPGIGLRYWKKVPHMSRLNYIRNTAGI